MVTSKTATSYATQNVSRDVNSVCGDGVLVPGHQPIDLARLVARSLVYVLILVVLATACFGAEKQRIQVNDYIIHVVVSPQTHQLKAQARVKFTALEDINIATFELHNALRPTRVIDTNGQSLSVERVSQDSTVRVSLPNGLTKGSSDTLIFEYEGAIQSGR